MKNFNEQTGELRVNDVLTTTFNEQTGVINFANSTSSQMTSIEWLEQKMQDMIKHGSDFGEDYPALMVHIQQAKEMHRKEIIDSFQSGDYGNIRNAVIYYKETFKKD